MQSEFVYQHILGGLANALIGDAMGSATETLTPEEIHQKFGGKVTRFLEPPEGTFAGGRRAGQVTDDTTQMLQIIDALVENDGRVTVDLVAQQLLRWAENEELFRRFAGPTTRKAIQLLQQGKDPHETGIPEKMGMGISNGAAMKIAPAGWLHPGDLDAAVQDAVTLCVPTHNADVAFAGAAAIAAAIAACLIPGTCQLSVVDAAIYGARKGYEIGKERALVLRSPSMVDRIQLAVEIAISQTDFETICERLAEVIGCGLPIIEAVPFAIGVFVASRGDPNLAVIGAVNMGGDADTTATITGAVAGTYAGISRIDQELYSTIIRVNGLDLENIAQKLTNIAMVSPLAPEVEGRLL